MKTQYDIIYLSPHLDDAVLSCGGQIRLQTDGGRTVLIVTVAAGEPQTDVRSLFAEFLHHNWGFTAKEGVAARRAEDQRAAERIGADVAHWTLPDCIYRLHPEKGEPLYSSEDDLFGAVHPTEEALVEELAQQMSELPPAECVVGPLGVGNHVDHQLTRAAAERHFGPALVYYEDYPYVQRQPENLPHFLRATESWRALTVPLSPRALEAKLEAIEQYRSQIGHLFNDVQAMRATVSAYVEGMDGERIWFPIERARLALLL